MTNFNIRNPFGYTQKYSVRVPSGATNQQLVRMPWQTPVQKPGYLIKVGITNPVGTAGRVDIWDQDLSNTTPPTAGSAGAALFVLGVNASALSGAGSLTTLYGLDDLASPPIIGGLACQSTHPGVTINFEVEYI